MKDYAWLALGFETVLLVVAGVALYFLWRQKNKWGRVSDLFEDSMGMPGRGLVFFDAEEKFLKANRQAYEFLPFIHKEQGDILTLDSFLNYLYDHAIEYDESLKNAIDKTARQQDSQDFREVIEWGEGSICHVEAKKTEGKRVVFVLDDISDLREHEQQFLRLNRYSHELTQAIEAAATGIIISDPKTENNPVIFANDAFCKLVEMPRREIVGNDWAFVLDALDNHDAAQSLFQAIKEGEATDIEVAISREASPRWFSVKLTPVKDSAERLDLFIGIFTETTEQKLREAEAFQGQKLEALGQLAAGVAHDFNNVLSIIDGYVRLASNEIEEGSKVSDYLEHTRVATKRAASLTQRMLMFSRHKIVTQDVIDLCEVVREQETLLRPLLDASIRFTMRTPPRQVCIEGAPDKVGQILMNFAVNARDAMPDGGAFMVEVKEVEKEELPSSIPEEEKENRFACLSVTDTGMGMDKETLNRVFDPFFTTKEQGKGTGLGLSMVYGLVKEIGGTIDVQSAPGRGTTMAVYILMSDKEPSRQVAGNVEDIKNLQLNGYTVLVAEDEPDLRMLVGGMLEKLGMTVIEASNGNEALAKQEDFEGKIDILLTDVVMPELNGVKLAELFQSLREETKIIFMSGYPANGKMARVELPEDAYFMAKPLEYESLARLVYQRLRENDNSNIDEEREVASAHWQTGGPAEQ